MGTLTIPVRHGMTGKRETRAPHLHRTDGHPYLT